MGGGTTKQEVDIEDAGEDELQLRALAEAFVNAAAQEQGYSFKQVETKVYKNQDLIDSYTSELKGVEDEIASLEANDSSNDPNTDEYARLAELRSQRTDLNSKISEEEKNATTSYEYKVFKEPPSQITSTIGQLSADDQTKLNDVIANYGYGSAEWYDAANKVKIPDSVASQYGLEAGSLSEGGQSQVDSLTKELEGYKSRLSPSLTQAQQMKLIGSIAATEKKIGDVYSNEGISRDGELTLADVGKKVSADAGAYAATEAEVKLNVMNRINDLLNGKLIDIPQDTVDKINGYVNDSYAAEIASVEESYKKLGMDAEEAKLKAQNFIKEQGIEKMTQINAEREAYRESFKRLSGDQQQAMLDLAASTGRSPLDEQFQRELNDRLGSYVAENESRYLALERGAKEQEQQQLAGIESQTALQKENLLQEEALNKRTLGAQAAAQKAGQVYALQTGMPMQGITSGQSQYQLNAALGTQQFANALSAAGAYGGLASPYQADRMAETTTTTTTTPSTFSSVVGGIGGLMSGAGGLLTGIGSL